MKDRFSIFYERPLRSVLDGQAQIVHNEIYSEEKNPLLNANETEYTEYLINKFKIEPLVLHLDQVSVSSCEEMIPAEWFPQHFNVFQGKRYPKQVVTYHIPYTGSPEFLKCQPTGYLGWTRKVYLEGNSLCFDIINWSDDAESIKREANEFLNNLRQQYQNLSNEIASFNGKLESEAKQIVQSRKAELLKQSNLLSSLGVSLYRAREVPTTFSVPVVKKKVIVKPHAPTESFAPEPTLDDSTYQEILTIINQFGTEMERHPGIYRAKDEPTLRDHFIMALSPQFNSVTGETFNKSGKTDILIRHDGKNVFVAECKFWKGTKEHFGTIDQLLSYLTWRDSKTAIICFVPNKELDPVLKAIETETSGHPCFVKNNGKKGENWFSYEFHLPKDSSRSVYLNVLCFHFPSI